MALTENDFVKVAQAMNAVTGLTACHSGDAENMVAAIRRAGLDLVESAGADLDNQAMKCALEIEIEAAFASTTRSKGNIIKRYLETAYAAGRRAEMTADLAVFDRFVKR